MDAKQYIVKTLAGNLEFVKMTLKDFTDADFLARPCPGANHPVWQLGHLTKVETAVIAGMDPKAAAALPDGFADLFKKDTAAFDDASKYGKFGTKDGILGQFEKARNATIAYANTLAAGDLDKASPEHFRQWAPTVGELLAGQASHVTMHVGQFQVLRRKLGKPLLF